MHVLVHDDQISFLEEISPETVELLPEDLFRVHLRAGLPFGCDGAPDLVLEDAVEVFGEIGFIQCEQVLLRVVEHCDVCHVVVLELVEVQEVVWPVGSSIKPTDDVVDAHFQQQIRW